MSVLALAPTQATIQTALRAFLQSILASTVDVIEAQDNEVAEPQDADFITMTVIRRDRLATNVDTLLPGGATMSVLQSNKVTVQLDVHSDDISDASDMAQTISTLFRDDYAVQFFLAYPGITPLYADDPRQVAFQNSEQQYESRYIVEAVLQADQLVTVPQQSATSIDLSVFNVDVEIPTPDGGPSLDYSDPDNSQYIPAL